MWVDWSRANSASSGENIGITVISTQCFGLDYMTIIQQFSRSTHDQVALLVICAHKGLNTVIEGKQGDRNKGATQEVIVNMSILASGFSWKPNSYPFERHICKYCCREK